MQHSPRPITCLSPASVSRLSGFRNPFPNPPSLSQLSRTSVSGQISRFDQELIYKVLLVLTTPGGGVVVLEIRIIGGCPLSAQLCWRNVLEICITDTGFSTSRRLPPASAAATIQNLRGFRGANAPSYFHSLRKQKMGRIPFPSLSKVFVTSSPKKHPQSPKEELWKRAVRSIDCMKGAAGHLWSKIYPPPSSANGTRQTTGSRVGKED